MLRTIHSVNIKKRLVNVPDEVLEQFRQYDAVTAYKAMGYRGAMDDKIKPLSSGMKMCGRALTVQTVDGDNLMVHKALQIAQPGDVIVINAGGEGSRSSTLGDVMIFQAKVSGLAGIVSNSSALDSIKIKKLGFPVFCNGVAIKGAQKSSLGWINYPISVGGVTVNPGDIILGDADGVTVVPAELAEETLEQCRAREEYEATVFERIENGEHLYDISEYEEIMLALGYTEE